MVASRPRPSALVGGHTPRGRGVLIAPYARREWK